MKNIIKTIISNIKLYVKYIIIFIIAQNCLSTKKFNINIDFNSHFLISSLNYYNLDL